MDWTITQGYQAIVGREVQRYLFFALTGDQLNNMDIPATPTPSSWLSNNFQ
jgi:hypothetical protein